MIHHEYSCLNNRNQNWFERILVRILVCRKRGMMYARMKISPCRGEDWSALLNPPNKLWSCCFFNCSLSLWKKLVCVFHNVHGFFLWHFIFLYCTTEYKLGKNVTVLYFKGLYNNDSCTVLWVKSRTATADGILQTDQLDELIKVNMFKYDCNILREYFVRPDEW